MGPDFVAPAVEPVIDLRDANGEKVDSPLDRTIEAAVVSLAAKIYVEQVLALGEETALLAGATSIGVYEVAGLVRSFGGTAFPAVTTVK